jgi:hypothetical protein
MKVLLDECVNRRLSRELLGHDVRTVPQQGWNSYQNGALLTLAAREGFEAFVTLDRSLRYQQNAAHHPLAILVLHTRSNRMVDCAH